MHPWRQAVLSLLVVGAAAGSSRAQTEAAFEADPASGTEPLLVQFHNLSSADTHTWVWAFGDGGISTEFEPQHVYQQAGEYTVSLLAIGTSSDFEIRDAVSVQPAQLDPQIAVSPAQGTPPLAVTFSDVGDGSEPQSWHWDFGDGATSSDATPTHVYWTPGSHDVTLTVGAGGSSASVSAPAAVQVDAPTVMQPAFDAAPSLGTFPLEVAFRYDGGGAEPDTFLWDFGDGGSSSARDPVHVYAAPGDYAVSLTTSVGGTTEGLLVPDVVHVLSWHVDFAEPLAHAAPASLQLVAVADATGDGHADVLAVGADLVVLPGAGDGTLGAATVHVVDGEYLPAAADIGDLDLDGLLDVVGVVRSEASPQDEHRLDIRLGDGQGGFGAGPHHPLTWSDADTTAHVLGDFLGNGLLDVAATHRLLINLLPGDGAGGLLPAGPDQPSALSDGRHRRLAAADFDLDGDLDLHATFHSFSGQGWVVYLGDGGGAFETACGGYPDSHAVMGSSHVGQLDDDGYPDIATSWGLPYCSFDPKPFAPLQTSSWAAGCPGWSLCDSVIPGFDVGGALVGIVDVDGAGAGELLTYDTFADLLSVRPQIAGPGFDVDVGPFALPRPELAGDLDGDGLPELVGRASDGAIWVSRNLTATPGWSDLGGGLGGANGIPTLTGSGAAQPDQLVQLSLIGAAANAPALLVLGFAQAGLPFLGGVLLPSPDVLAPLTTDANGQLALHDRWPAELGPGTPTWWQVWVADAGAPGGASASNALRHVVPAP